VKSLPAKVEIESKFEGSVDLALMNEEMSAFS
jgi:hypothetical protein